MYQLETACLTDSFLDCFSEQPVAEDLIVVNPTPAEPQSNLEVLKTLSVAKWNPKVHAVKNIELLNVKNR